MKLLKKYLFLIIFLVALGASYVYFNAQQTRYKKITSFEDCVTAGFFVTSTYPEKCLLPGKVFINTTQNKQPVTTEKVIATIEDSSKNLSYIVDGQKVIFYDGVGMLSSSASKNTATTTLEITSTQGSFDINGDFSPDLVFLIKKYVDSRRGDYYLSSAITLHEGYVGLNALYLDTNIASTTIIYKNNEIRIEYYTLSGAKKSKHFIFKNAILEELLNK